MSKQKSKATTQPLYILITRPKPAGEILSQKVTAAGFNAVFFPTITFLPPANPQVFQQAVVDLGQYDWLIFISPQAVYAASSAIHDCWPALPTRLKIAAVGAGTAAALQAENFPAVHYPVQKWNSEGLLELPEFHDVNGKKIALICGENGRELLASTLIQRGAKVVPIIAYRRTLPSTDVNKILMLLRHNQLGVIICSSAEGLQSLIRLLAAERQKLLEIPFIIISTRMQAQAKKLGIKKILLAKNASHDAIIEVLNEQFAHYSQQGLTMENQTERTELNSHTATIASRRYLTWSSMGILFSTVGFMVLVAAFYFSYVALIKGSNQLMSLTLALTDKVVANQQDIATLRKSIAETQQHLAQLQTTLTDQQMQEALKIDEAQYLATLAQDNLQIGDNLPLVIMLLQTADQKLSDLTQPTLLPARKALAAAIAALQAVPTVDLTGIYLQLAALNNQVDKLPLPTLRAADETTAAATASKRLAWWQRGLQQSWAALRKIVVIRYNKAGQQPFITPAQQQFLYQNLHAMFEQAMSALVHKQPEIYHASLEQVTNWIKQYFLIDAPATQAMLTSLSQLQTQNIKPALPDISAMLQMFHNVALNQTVKKSSATITSQQ